MAMTYPTAYDVIVIGAGHAGCEAAHAAARMGCRTLLLTMQLDTIAQMSCNPAIGGLGKSHLVREVDALGGLMGIVADHTGMQFRMLNTSKGPAVQALRAQTDRHAYSRVMRQFLEATPLLVIAEGMAVALDADAQGVRGVVCADGCAIAARAVVVTTGTFLQGMLHIGALMLPGGRGGEPPAVGLSDSMRALGLQLGRLKTGTPPRLDQHSIDFTRMRAQAGDPDPTAFSFLHRTPPALAEMPQVPCHITHTTAQTKEIIERNLARAPLYTGQIQGVGPRYCPSIEDKIKRFADKETHLVFIEPEGCATNEMYPNGISTSLPLDVQIELVRSIAGLEQAEIIKPGYAIEYDFCDPADLRATLASKIVPRLFLAGQINGTSGYEEAAAQGILAGINAAAAVRDHDPLTLDRSQAYLGVMIDDLITRGVTEPYRMFTSRAEYRLILRQDNADARLTEIGRACGLIDDARYAAFTRKRAAIENELTELHTRRKDGQPLAKHLAAPETTRADYASLRGEAVLDDPAVLDAVLIECKYAGYIERQHAVIEKSARLEKKRIPATFDYCAIPGLRIEARQKFARIQPQSLGQASRIEGVTPADMTLLAAFLTRGTRAAKVVQSHVTTQKETAT
jgi:tRNA uridine 5-carboxymethylaminomethyl modification enzyme